MGPAVGFAAAGRRAAARLAPAAGRHPGPTRVASAFGRGAPPSAGAPPPGWPPTAASATAPWPPTASAGPSTSALVVVAGIFLLLAGILTFGFGVLFGLLGGLIAAVGTSEEGFEVFGPLGGVVAGFAFLVVFWGLLEVVAAIGMFAHRGWGRALGLIVGVVGVLFTGLGLWGVAMGTDANAGGLGVSLVLLAGYGLTVLALVTGGEHFRRRA